MSNAKTAHTDRKYVNESQALQVETKKQMQVQENQAARETKHRPDRLDISRYVAPADLATSLCPVFLPRFPYQYQHGRLIECSIASTAPAISFVATFLCERQNNWLVTHDARVCRYAGYTGVAVVWPRPRRQRAGGPRWSIMHDASRGGEVGGQSWMQLVQDVCIEVQM